jgi:hypothetical protein
MDANNHFNACCQQRRLVEYKLVSYDKASDLEKNVNLSIKEGFVPCDVGFIRSVSRDFHYQVLCKYEENRVVGDKSDN